MCQRQFRLVAGGFSLTKPQIFFERNDRARYLQTKEARLADNQVSESR